MLGVFAKFERAMSAERVHAGLAAWQGQGPMESNSVGDKTERAIRAAPAKANRPGLRKTTRHITPPAHAQGFQFYAAKDRAMAQSADFGLMLWDGKSVGTLANAMRLARLGKATVLFDASRGSTLNIQAPEQWHSFAATIKPALLGALRSRVASEGD
jgi:hypothetical protein